VTKASAAAGTGAQFTDGNLEPRMRHPASGVLSLRTWRRLTHGCARPGLRSCKQTKSHCQRTNRTAICFDLHRITVQSRDPIRSFDNSLRELIFVSFGNYRAQRFNCRFGICLANARRLGQHEWPQCTLLSCTARLLRAATCRPVPQHARSKYGRPTISSASEGECLRCHGLGLRGRSPLGPRLTPTRSREEISNAT